MKCYIFQLDFSETFNIEQMYSESKPNMTKYGKFWIYSQKWVKKRRGILFKNLYLASNKKKPRVYHTFLFLIYQHWCMRDRFNTK